MIILSESINEGREVLAKEQEYFDYIKDHVNNVNKMYQDIFVHNIGVLQTESISRSEFKEAIISIKDDVANHDASKFGNEEFEGYRVKYHPTEKEQRLMNEDILYADMIQKSMDTAWMHHQANNNHHPGFWCLDQNQEFGDPKDMTLGAIIHMICDWEAMSYHFKTDTLEWYSNAETEKSQMTFQTKMYVEEILDLIHNK